MRASYRRLVWLSISCLGCLLSACTTVVRGVNETFEVKTEPPGAVVTTSLDKGDRGCAATPCAFKVSRKETFIARVEKPGYHPVRIIVRNSEFVRAEIDDQKALEANSKQSGILPTDLATMVSSAGFTVGAASNTGLSGALNSAFGGMNGGLVAFYAAPVVSGLDTVTGSQLNLYPNPVSLVLIPETVDVPDAYKIRHTPEDEELFTNLNRDSSPGEP